MFSQYCQHYRFQLKLQFVCHYGGIEQQIGINYSSFACFHYVIEEIECGSSIRRSHFLIFKFLQLVEGEVRILSINVPQLSQY